MSDYEYFVHGSKIVLSFALFWIIGLAASRLLIGFILGAILFVCMSLIGIKIGHDAFIQVKDLIVTSVYLSFVVAGLNILTIVAALIGFVSGASFRKQ